jgi:hypothetical protein
MRYKALDLILLIVLAVGGVLAWQSSRERSRLMATHARLVAITGDFQITDPTLIHVLALETDDPKHFAWRIYLPPGPKQDIRVRSGHGTFSQSNSNTKPSDSIARVVLREDKNGLLEIYSRFSRGSSRTNMGEKALADLLRGRWESLRVEQAGAGGTARLDPKKPYTLLRLTLPEDMQAEALAKLPEHIRKQYVPELLHIELIPSAPRP